MRLMPACMAALAFACLVTGCRQPLSSSSVDSSVSSAVSSSIASPSSSAVPSASASSVASASLSSSSSSMPASSTPSSSAAQSPPSQPQGQSPALEPAEEDATTPDIGAGTDGPQLEPSEDGSTVPDIGAGADGPQLEPPEDGSTVPDIGAGAGQSPTDPLKSSASPSTGEGTGELPGEVNPNVGDGTTQSQQNGENGMYLADPAKKVQPFETEIPVQVLDSDGNPLANVGLVTGYAEKNGAETWIRPGSYQQTVTNHEGKATLFWQGEYLETVLYLLPPQENARKRLDRDYNQSYEAFPISLQSQAVQQQVTLTLTGSYDWPDVPTLELTLQYADGSPCVDYYCSFVQKTNLPSQTYVQTGVYFLVTGDSTTDQNGKLVRYGLAEGTWEVWVAPRESWEQHRIEGTLTILPFSVKKYGQKNTITLTMPS